MRARVIGGIGVLAVAMILLANAGIGGGQTENQDTFPATDPGEEKKYVTITFDDAYKSQYRGASELDERGMNGVFYVPTARLSGSFEGIATMSAADVQDLQRRGHEIGGHTYNHTDMSTLSTEALTTSIEKNRAALNALGVEPISFAYPYGKGTQHSDTVKNYYEYGRTVRWDVNAIPATSPARLATIALTEDNHNVLDAHIDRMERGNWLILSIHHIDGNGTVDRENVDVSPETYESILDHIDREDLEVVTFEDVQEREGR